MKLLSALLFCVVLNLAHGQEPLTNYVRIRGENDDENNGYVITEEIEDLTGNCVFQAKKIVEVCANGKWAVYTREKFSLNSTVLFVPNTCIDDKNPYNIDLEKYADVQSARPIGHSDPNVVQLSVYQGKFFKGKSKDFVVSKKIRFTANSAVVTGGKKWVLYKKENDTSSAVCLSPSGLSFVILEHEDLKEFRFVSAEVLPNIDDECPQGAKAIVIPGGISARSDIPLLLPAGEDSHYWSNQNHGQDSVIVDSLNK